MNRTIDRREFLSVSGGLAASLLLARWAWATETRKDIKITRILRFDLVSRRIKLAGKNSRLDVHGDTATDRMIRVYTDAGIEGILKEAAMAGDFGLQVAPHNWGSLIGFYSMLHVGCTITNFYRAENDPVESDVLIADGYTVKEGLATVPDAPGFGLRINEERFAATIRPHFDLRLRAS